MFCNHEKLVSMWSKVKMEHESMKVAAWGGEFTSDSSKKVSKKSFHCHIYHHHLRITHVN